MPKIMVFSGSSRAFSFNKMLAALAAEKARGLGADVTLVDLKQFPMPLYDGDTEEEQGLPNNAVKLRDAMLQHDGLLLACPEYNGSVTPLLKNTIDWTSRPSEGVPMVAAYTGKVAGLLSASPGGLGGMRGLVHVQAILSGIGVHVIPSQASIGSAHSAFAENGTLKDAKNDARVQGVVASLVEVVRKLHG